MIKIKLKYKLNLYDSITCGQIFRFDVEDDDSLTVILKDRVVNLKLDGNTLIIESNNEYNLKEVIEDYLDLNRDYSLINNILVESDSFMKKIIPSCDGFKVIKQDPLETFVEYVISQNNSVRNIRCFLDNLAFKYGSRVDFNGKYYYLLPDINTLSKLKENDYRELKAGFRDKYLFNIIQKIYNNEIDLNSFYKMNTKEALEDLMSFKGIGNKVASCILLFAYQKYDVFPIDTWVKKVFKEEYNITDNKEMIEYAKNHYKVYSGIAIQYMFHYNRNKK